MAYQIGDKITELSLPSIDGSQFTLQQVQGKRYMLSFMRFAACPFCQLRIHQLISRWQELDENFTVIAVFDSPLGNLQKQSNKELAPFPILADEHYFYYQKFAIKQSISGMFKAMLFRMPSLLYAMIKGYFPSSIKGKVTTLPADFLVDEHGVIQLIYYGKDSGNHLPFEQVKDFSKLKTNKYKE
ncbi:MAG: redoxin domain-containing protein [Methylococcales bacterium]|nr:redoxin domain-containing protein [Methylococcales bacterium]